MVNIEKLRTDFDNIINKYNQITEKKSNLTEKLDFLKKIYNKLVKNNNNKVILFCLDSFYFQYKILTVDMENILHFKSLINNRIYGDYYKLYNIIISQISEKKIDLLNIDYNTDKYPPYKDLEIYFEYDMNHIINIHNEILKIIDDLHKYYVMNERKIKTYTFIG